VSGLHTIDRWLRDRARLTPARVAIEHPGGELTYGELEERSDRLAASLSARGLERGDRVATLTGNSPEHVEAFYACAKAGLMLVPLNWRLSPVELAYQVDDAEPALLLVEQEYDDLAAATLAESRHAPERWRLGELGDGGALAADVSDEDGLLLVYTSGTTGKPKGAVLTHANCYWTNLGFDVSTGVTGDDVVLQVLPQFTAAAGTSTRCSPGGRARGSCSSARSSPSAAWS
jgi:fatty-acyl-CoA synthase